MWPPEKSDELPSDHSAPSRRFSLTEIRITNLTPSAKLYEVTDPGFAALTLRIAPSGTKTWIYRFSWEGRRKPLRLGIWPDTSLGRRVVCLEPRANLPADRMAPPQIMTSYPILE